MDPDERPAGGLQGSAGSAGPDGSDGPADSIEAFAGDPAGGRMLRHSLEVLAREYAGHPLAHQIAAVLDGRKDMRDLAGDPELATLAQQGMRRFAEQWEQLGPEERAELIAQGEEAAGALDDDGRDDRRG